MWGLILENDIHQPQTFGNSASKWTEISNARVKIVPVNKQGKACEERQHYLFSQLT